MQLQRALFLVPVDSRCIVTSKSRLALNFDLHDPFLAVLVYAVY